MEVENRVFFDQDGDIVFQTGEMEGDVLPRKELTEVHYIDIPFGTIDYMSQKLIGVNPVTKEPIFETIEQVMTPEQQIKELEDALLLAADAETGGIL